MVLNERSFDQSIVRSIIGQGSQLDQLAYSLKHKQLVNDLNKRLLGTAGDYRKGVQTFI